MLLFPLEFPFHPSLGIPPILDRLLHFFFCPLLIDIFVDVVEPDLLDVLLYGVVGGHIVNV